MPIIDEIQNFSDDLIKHAAARIIIGVVGNPGTIMPIKPIVDNNIPNTSQKYLMTELLLIFIYQFI